MDEDVDATTGWEVHQVLSLYGHLVDDAAWDELGRVFTDDVEVETPGGTAHGRAELAGWYAGFAAATGTPMPAHHVVNVIVRRGPDGTVRAWSRCLLVAPDGSTETVDHVDELVRTDDGRRVARRRILPRGTAAAGTFRSWLDG